MTLTEATWDEALEISRTAFKSCPVESIALSAAQGRVLGADMYALCNLPAFETSSMDGWVVNGQAPWKIMGEVVTGALSNFSLQSSQCLGIATGGVIPNGGQSVIPWEMAEEHDGFVNGQNLLGENIRSAGAECKAGELLISSGTQLNAPKIGLLASAGHEDVIVSQTPRIAIFFLGDELVHSGLPAGGLVRDALGPQLPALLQAFGAEVIVSDFVTDDLEILIRKISTVISAGENAVDMIITTGGTADGPRDFVKPALAALGGRYLIDRVKVRPGYHLLLASIATSDKRNIAFLALPGNPQSALAALLSCGRPVIDALRGATPIRIAQVEMAQEIKTQIGFARLVPGTLEKNTFTPTLYLGSNMLRGVASAEGFAVVSENGPTRWLPIPQ